ncbi:protein kinase [bacterium]|nr:protein kinase [bacterium]
MIPGTIDRFRVIKLIGRGGQGEVYHVRDTDQTEYALKWLLPQVVERGLSDRLIREFHSIAQLDHPGIIKANEQGYFDGRPFFTMELVQGQNLAVFIEKEKCFNTYYKILIQVCDTLAYIHDHRLIHRDIKPTNILIDKSGQPRLMDFGLVKNLDATIQLTQTNKILGTLTYVSPEQIWGEDIDFRSDLYSLGIVMYRMFSSRLPFLSDSLPDLASMHLFTVPAPLSDIVPDCPALLSDLCAQLLEKSPWDRPSSAKYVADVLQRLLETKNLPQIEKKPEDIQIQYNLQPRFTGRESELGLLLDSLEPDTQFCIQLISGRNGIGKSRLLVEALKQSIARGSSRTVIRWNRKQQHYNNDPGNLFHQIATEITRQKLEMGDLIDLLPEIVPLHPAFHQFAESSNIVSSQLDSSSRNYKIRYLTAIIAFLSRKNPWHIIWENIHKGDAFQLEFLQDLIDFNRHQEIHCCIWASLRENDFKTSDEFNRFLSLFKRVKLFDLLRLKVLTVSDSAKIASSLTNYPETAQEIQDIAKFCNGIPSVIVQAIHNLQEKGDLSSETIQAMQIEEIISQQLARISAGARELLTWTAVLRQDTYLVVFKYILKCSEQDLLEMLNDLLFRNLIVSHSDDNGEQFTVAGHIARKMILASVSPEKIRNIHLDVVSILEDLGTKYASSDSLAYHLEKAKEIARACKYYYKSASDSLDNNQIFHARDIISKAISLLPELPEADTTRNQLLRARILVLRGLIFNHVGNLAQQKPFIAELTNLLPEIQEQSLQLKMYWNIISYHISNYEFAQVEIFFKEVKQISIDQGTQLDPLYFEYKGTLCIFRQDYIGARKFSKIALVMRIANKEPPVVLVKILSNIAKTLTGTGNINASASLLQYALKQLAQEKVLPVRARILSELGNVEISRNNFTRARKFLNKAYRAHTNMGAEYSRACNLHDIGLTYYLETDYQNAHELLSQSVDIFCILTTPRECLTGTLSLLLTQLSLGFFNEAEIAYRRICDLFSEKTILEQNPQLICQYYRVLLKMADKTVLRKLLKKLVTLLLSLDRKVWETEIRCLIISQLIAENRFLAADRLLSKMLKPKKNNVTENPSDFVLQLLLVRIQYIPDENHTHLLDDILAVYPTQKSSHKHEYQCLKQILQICNHSTESPAEKIWLTAFEDSIVRCQDVLVQWWYWDILAYFAQRQGFDSLRENAEESSKTIRMRLAQGLSEPDKNHFLSRQIVARI